ncbi:hypothetical protein PAEAM_40890 [Paenibacillus sp. GM1FR]|nr:hypothetical protein PAEAM_40890 [Paenibacillus sp. GM1FR]
MTKLHVREAVSTDAQAGEQLNHKVALFLGKKKV